MSANALILLATGKDRPGIVDRISGHVFESGCNLEDSRMAILGGEFALIALLTGRVEGLEKVQSGIPRIARELDLTVQFKATTAGPQARRGAVPSLSYRIHAVAMDHPGIVHGITRILSRHGVNVARLDSSLSSAPVTGTPVFAVELEVEVPTEVLVASLRSELQRFAEEENIDLELRAAT